MTCAIDGCAREKHRNRALCLPHFVEYGGSGECARGREIADQPGCDETAQARVRLPLGDFIRRVSAEERNKKR